MNSPYVSELQKCHGEFLTAFPKPHVAPCTIWNRESCHLCYLIYSYPNPTPYHPKVFPHYIGINVTTSYIQVVTRERETEMYAKQSNRDIKLKFQGPIKK